MRVVSLSVHRHIPWKSDNELNINAYYKSQHSTKICLRRVYILNSFMLIYKKVSTEFLLTVTFVDIRNMKATCRINVTNFRRDSYSYSVCYTSDWNLFEMRQLWFFFWFFMQYLVIGVVNNCFNTNLEPWNEVIKIVRNAKIDYKQKNHISNNRQEEYHVSHLSLLNSCRPFIQSFIYNVFSLTVYFPYGKGCF